MADQHQTSSFDYLGSDEALDLPPTSVTHLREAGTGARLMRTLLSCAIVGGVFAFVVPMLPNTDSNAALHAPKAVDQQASADQQEGGSNALVAQHVGAYRQDVSYMHGPERAGRQRI